MNRFSINIVLTQIAVMSFLALSGLTGAAFAEDELFPTEPPLADSGWTVPYNELLLACPRPPHHAYASLTSIALPKTMMVAAMPMALSGCASPCLRNHCTFSAAEQCASGEWAMGQ
jgi:hypothetical protein